MRIKDTFRSTPALLAALIITAVAAVASGALVYRLASPRPAPQSPPPADNIGQMQWLQSPRAVAATPFTDGAGKAVMLVDFRGKVLVVNFWATWCAPCVKEMPTLDALQAQLGGKAFAVIAINQDRDGAKVAPFVQNNGWTHLALYTEPGGHFVHDEDLVGLPTSLIVDQDGREVARVEGPRDWQSAETIAALKQLIAKTQPP
jgi:thiol-disulfide isomerase/thioredoxin